MKETTRIVADIPTEKHRKFKLFCVKNGTTIRGKIEELIDVIISEDQELRIYTKSEGL